MVIIILPSQPHTAGRLTRLHCPIRRHRHLSQQDDHRVSIAAPVGPIGVLASGAAGRWGLHGLASGLGAASADAIYGSIAGFGLTAISGFLVAQGDWLRLIGGVFLVYLGARTFLTRPAERPAGAAGRGLASAYASTFALTLTNPVTILSFAAIFAGLGLAEREADYGAAVALVAGVFSGSAAWWLLLSGSVSLFRRAFTPSRMRWINRLSGAVLTGFGVLALAGGLI